MLRDVLGRIERRLKVLEISATQASKEAGLSEDAIRNMRRAVKGGQNRTGVSTTTINALAPVLRTSPGWLMTGEGPEDAAGPRTVPLVGYVGAGSEAHYYAAGDSGLGEVDAPERSSDNTVAVEVRGTSLGPIFERWLIYYDDVRSPVTPDLYGRLCIVGLPDARVLVKMIRPASLPHHFHLLSNNEEPLLDQEVVWAARVRSMTPR